MKLIVCSWSLRCADHSSRRVVPSVECPMSVTEKPHKEEALTRNRSEAPQEKKLSINQLIAKSGNL